MAKTSAAKTYDGPFDEAEIYLADGTTVIVKRGDPLPGAAPSEPTKQGDES